MNLASAPPSHTCSQSPLHWGAPFTPVTPRRVAWQQLVSRVPVPARTHHSRWLTPTTPIATHP